MHTNTGCDSLMHGVSAYRPLPAFKTLEINDIVKHDERL